MHELQAADFYILTFLLFILFIIGTIVVDLNGFTQIIKKIWRKFFKSRNTSE
jgi:hypothetical protein